MNRFLIKIRSSVDIKDLTIIYKEGEDKLHEIKTSKKDILANLHYFEQRKKEIDLTNMIYIEENIPFEIFSEFISSIITKEAEVDENNYEAYLHLCNKYGYYELQEEIKQFATLRPDIKSIADEFSKTINETRTNEDTQLNSLDKEGKKEDFQINFIREEILAKNLDVCIINRFLDKIPIHILTRILNSPKRVINDHHLLFSFVIELIEKNEKVAMSNLERENFLILPSCLDYCLMNDEEIQKLIEVEKSANFFISKNADKKIKQFIDKEAEMANIQSHLQSQIKEMKEKEEVYVKRIDAIEKSLGDMTKAIEQRMGAFENEYNERKNQDVAMLQSQIKEMKEKEEVYVKRIDALEKSLGDMTKTIEQRIGVLENEINERKKQESALLEMVGKQKEIISKNEEAIKKLEQQNLEYKAKQANLKNEHQQLMQKPKEKNKEPNLTKCPYSNDYLSGIIKHLEGMSTDKNDFTDVVKISGGGKPGYPITNLIKYDVSNSFYYNYPNQNAVYGEGWILFDFLQRKINLTSYVLRNAYTYQYNPKSWKIVGSNDGTQWDILNQQTDFSEFKNNNYKSVRFECESNNKYYRYIKYIQNDSWPSGGQYSFSLTCIEFFGSILSP